MSLKTEYQTVTNNNYADKTSSKTDVKKHGLTPEEERKLTDNFSISNDNQDLHNKLFDIKNLNIDYDEVKEVGITLARLIGTVGVCLALPFTCSIVETSMRKEFRTKIKQIATQTISSNIKRFKPIAIPKPAFRWGIAGAAVALAAACVPLVTAGKKS